MAWKGVTVDEQRKRFLEDYQMNYYTITELAERFTISRKTAHKWIKRYMVITGSSFRAQSHQKSARRCLPHKMPSSKSFFSLQ